MEFNEPKVEVIELSDSIILAQNSSCDFGESKCDDSFTGGGETCIGTQPGRTPCTDFM